MHKAGEIILIISIIINFILGIIVLNRPKRVEPNVDIYTKKIDSLKSELSALQHTRDSVRSSIDTITIKIKDNEKSYEETYDIILSNSVNDDYLFFTRYLEQNKERRDSNNHS